MLHIAAHLLVPLLVALIFFRPHWQSSYLIMLLGWVIDVDHLLADPIYDPLRCSVGFHPLHSYWAISGYTLLLCFRKTRLLGLGLMIHIVLDAFDCIYTQGVWSV